MKSWLRRLITSVMLLASVLLLAGACASARYGQVPCPCENTGRK